MLRDKSQKAICFCKVATFTKKVGLLAYFTISVVSSTATSIYDIGEHLLKDGIHPYSEYLILQLRRMSVFFMSFGISSQVKQCQQSVCLV